MRTWMIIWFGLSVMGGHAQKEQKRPAALPDHVKAQFAGTIGFISVGAGYDWSKGKLEGDVYYGYVPSWVGGVDIHSLTAKLTWLPLEREYSNNIIIDWLNAGILLNYAFGRRYHLFSRTRYSFVYYGFPTAAHVAFFLGGGVTKKNVGLYYEFGTTDSKLVSFASNSKAIPFTDIINIGFGVRLKLN